jgi:hypothetical protein
MGRPRHEIPQRPRSREALRKDTAKASPPPCRFLPPQDAPGLACALGVGRWMVGVGRGC